MTTPVSSGNSPTAHMVHALAISQVPTEGVHPDKPLETQPAFSQLLQANEELQRALKYKEILQLEWEKGVTFICYRDPVDPVRLAFSMAIALLSQRELHYSMAIHSGAIHPLGWIDPNQADGAAKEMRAREVLGSASWLAANARVLRTAQRLADLGDQGHILVSENTAAYLQSRTDWRGTLRDLGEREVEPGFSLRLYNLYSDRVGNPDPPLQVQRLPLPKKEGSGPRIVLLFKARAIPDQQLAFYLEEALASQKLEVFLDRRQVSGVAWAQGLDRKIRDSEAVIALVSPESAESEMFIYEVELAYLAGHQQNGFPRIWPVRINYAGAFPEPLQTMIGPLEYRWDVEQEYHQSARLVYIHAADKPLILAALLERIQLLAQERAELLNRRETALKEAVKKPIPRAPLEPAGGAVPVDSAFYIVRPTDEQFRDALARHDSIILLKGARQMGKTSLLGRGLHLARHSGTRVILTDFQKLQASDFRAIEPFFRALREMIVDQLGSPEQSLQAWDERRNPNSNFERFWRQDILERFAGPVAWGCDEFDRLFATTFASEVCGLFRSWHNERVLDPSTPWARLTLAISYATEAHLFITDLNQSPFNVGTRLNLDDFTLEQVSELNRRYGQPLAGDSDLSAFYELLAGHPYLVRRALQEMVSQGLDLQALKQHAADDEGIFGDHLRRILVSLSKEPELAATVRDLLEGRGYPTPASFYRLRSAGLISGKAPEEARVRCGLYERYLRRHLSP